MFVFLFTPVKFQESIFKTVEPQHKDYTCIQFIALYKLKKAVSIKDKVGTISKQQSHFVARVAICYSITIGIPAGIHFKKAAGFA